ncbi:MAG: hypothetical protein ACREJU_17895 [Nitrospiraceae bacterium]
MSGFRFAIGQRVRVLTHPHKPIVVVEERWPGAAWKDPYDENIYQVSGFLVKQRERALEAMNGDQPTQEN